MEKKITIHNIRNFILGWTRYILLKASIKSINNDETNIISLLPKHKQEQFKYRLKVMDSDCRNDGHCKICGCQTPQLQMIDDSCEGKCYPPMMDRDEWFKYKVDNSINLKD